MRRSGAGEFAWLRRRPGGDMLGITLELGLCLLGTSLYLFHQTTLHRFSQLTRQIETATDRPRAPATQSTESNSSGLEPAVQEVARTKEGRAATSQPRAAGFGQAISMCRYRTHPNHCLKLLSRYSESKPRTTRCPVSGKRFTPKQ